jgi:hypothetical protein
VIHRLLSWQGMVDQMWLIFLLFMLWYFWRERKKLAQTKDWLITKGRITVFEWTRENEQLWPKIEYSYQVFDKNFYGNYFFLDTAHNTPNSKYARKVAYRAAIAYEKNTEIDIYYNPNFPEESALDIVIPRKLNIIIWLLAVLIVFHLVVMAHRLLH